MKNPKKNQNPKSEKKPSPTNPEKVQKKSKS
jgi:hypothetical protein